MPFRVAVAGSKIYDVESFDKVLRRENLESQIELVHFNCPLNSTTVNQFTSDKFDGICCFVNDKVTADVVRELHKANIKLIALRCAGFDMIDLDECSKLGVSVVRVPAYSPHAVAEFAMALIQTLNRNVHKAYNRVRDANFTLDGLVGYDLHGKTVGIIGTGKIGQCFANIAIGYGCKILAYDVFECEALKARPEVTYVTLDRVFKESDFISLHAPLTPGTTYIVNSETLGMMKPHCIIVNTSRGKLINTKDLVEALVQGRMGGAALDVYENEQGYFFNDLSSGVIQDALLTRLTNMRNVIVTSHQAFLSHEALDAIASVTLKNCVQYIGGKRLSALENCVANC